MKKSNFKLEQYFPSKQEGTKVRTKNAAEFRSSKGR